MAIARAGSSAPSVGAASQIVAVHEPHREIDAAVDVARVVDRDDVRVLERHHELRLAREALAEAIVARQGRRDELERNRPLQAQVVRPVDDAHPAAADQLLDPVAEEVGADVNGRGDVHARCLGSKPTPAALRPRLSLS